jgi:hypothetical protein
MGEIATQQARGLALQTISDAMTFGKMVAGSDFAPKDFRGKPESCVLAMQHGAELGLSPMQAIQSIAVVNGRPSVYGDTAKAICLAAPVCEWITETVEGEGETMVAICTAKRRGSPEATVVQFSVADAKKAQLWGKSGPWTQYARRMLQMRARGFALRDAFPDVLRGLITAEEAQDYPTPEPAREPIVVRTRATPQRHPEPTVVRIEKKTIPVEAGKQTLYEKALDKIRKVPFGDRDAMEGCLNRIDELRRSGEMTADDASKLIVFIDERQTMQDFGQTAAAIEEGA